MTVSSTSKLSMRPVVSKLPQAALVGAVLALIGNLIIISVGRGFGTEFMLVPPGGDALEPLPFFPVVTAATVLPAIGAAVLLYVLTLYTQHPYPIFWAIAGIFLILSFQGPLGTLTDTPQTVIGLNIMHVWTALSIVGALSALPQAES